jgi:gamma-glutamylcyclotransferase (GGCT)/AIG2-like uncharacterized protein YtfP
MALLFVYGTLRRQSRHPMARLLAERATFLGEAKTRGRLYDLGRYPGAVPSTNEDWIFGDVYDLGEDMALLTELDAYEIAESPQPAFFDRQSVEVIRPPDVRETAWIYWFVGPMPHAVLIASGHYEKNFVTDV